MTGRRSRIGGKYVSRRSGSADIQIQGKNRRARRHDAIRACLFILPNFDATSVVAGTRAEPSTTDEPNTEAFGSQKRNRRAIGSQAKQLLHPQI
jgi:hypothetical protein